MSIFYRRYATAENIDFPLIVFDDPDFITSFPTFETGDIKIIIDSNTATDFDVSEVSWLGSGWIRAALTAVQLTGKKIKMTIHDQTVPQAYEDQAVLIETYGDENAQHNLPGNYLIPPALGGSKCRVYERLFKQDDTNKADSVISYANIITLPYNYSSSLHPGSQVEGTYNSTTGIVYWDVVWGASVEFLIKEYGMRKIATIPELSEIRLYDL